MYIFMLAPPQLTRTISACFSQLVKCTAGEPSSLRYQLSTFVDADTSSSRAPLEAVHPRS